MTDWMRRHGRWMEGYVKPRPEPQPSPDESTKDMEKSDYGVVFYPVRCPRCDSKDVSCYKSVPPVRYHKCKRCEYRFKSREAA